jgi:hypothetical protein
LDARTIIMRFWIPSEPAPDNTHIQRAKWRIGASCPADLGGLVSVGACIFGVWNGKERTPAIV